MARAMDDCVIVGGGVIGLTLAYELAGAGAKVHVVDRAAPGQEASWAGAGILPPANFAAPRTPDEKLARMCHDLHPRLAAALREETGIATGFTRCGGLYLAETSALAVELRCQAEALRAQGVTAIDVTAGGLAEIEPALRAYERAQPNVAACFLPDEAQLRNPRHVRALAAACRARGVRITPGLAVDDFETSGARVTGLRTATGTIPAGSVCVTSGAWSGGLLARLGARVALRPIRGQIVLLAAAPRTLRRVVNRGRCYLVPRDDGRVLAGSTEEDAGFDKRTTAEAIAELLHMAVTLVPALADAPLERTWAGLRPATPDGRPYLGRVPGWENAYVAAGHFRSGLQLSPGTAVLLRQAMLGQPTDVDLAAFALDRG